MLINLHISSFALFHAITFERSIFTKKCCFKNKASVVLNPLVSPIGRVVARSDRKRGNRQTDGQTDGMTKRNPRCACAPRVNSIMDSEMPHFLIWSLSSSVWHIMHTEYFLSFTCLLSFFLLL